MRSSSGALWDASPMPVTPALVLSRVRIQLPRALTFTVKISRPVTVMEAASLSGGAAIMAGAKARDWSKRLLCMRQIVPRRDTIPVAQAFLPVLGLRAYESAIAGRNSFGRGASCGPHISAPVNLRSRRKNDGYLVAHLSLQAAVRRGRQSGECVEGHRA